MGEVVRATVTGVGEALGTADLDRHSLARFASLVTARAERILKTV
jgi:hypothetical protein